MLYALIPPEGMNSMPLVHLSSPEETNIYVSDTCLIKPVCNVKIYIVSIYIICFINSRKYHPARAAPAAYTIIRAKNPKGAE